jgi:hypothetical protein
VRVHAQTKEHGFQARGCGEWARLRRAQAELEEETGNAAFLGASLADTLRQCVRLGNHRAAARLRADFKVSDRRFWWLKVGGAAPLHAPLYATGLHVLLQIAVPCSRISLHAWNISWATCEKRAPCLNAKARRQGVCSEHMVWHARR